MNICGFKIPNELIKLIESGWWPNRDNSQMQNLTCLMNVENIRKISKIDDQIYFYPPPFVLVSEEVKQNPLFWNDPIAAIHEIDIYKAIIIGDFGLGSDSPILLDYRKSHDEPSIIYLKYSNKGRLTHWHECASTFGDFLNILGIRIT